LLLIDNASNNGICESLDFSWHPKHRLVREDRLGLTWARLRAISETCSEILLFLDDDNLIDECYAENLLNLAGDYSKVGCFGAGRIVPEFEVDPPAEFHPHLPMLALREVNRTCWSNVANDPRRPWGAGLAVRRAVAEQYANAVCTNSLRALLGRQGMDLNSGEDDEFSWAACEMGLGMGLFPELKVVHLIDRRRLELDYLLRIAEGHAFSQAILDHLHGKTVREPEPLPSVGAVLSSVVRARVSGVLYESLRLWNYRDKSSFERAFESACRRGVARACSVIAENDRITASTMFP
jgi:glycosyltransferase involved in cell wall biosynthesis